MFSPFCLLFISGALYGLYGREKLQETPSLSLIIDAALLFIVSHSGLVLNSYVEVLIWCITYIIFLELAQRIKNIPSLLESLGHYSYGLYLMHVVWINVAIYLIIKYLPHSRLSLYFIFTISISCIGGVAFGMLDHFLYKKKLKPWLKNVRSLFVKTTIPPITQPDLSS